jgi:hypothetical protein
MLNSSVNFVIYVVYHKRFRQLFCDLCCCTPLLSPGAAGACCGRVSPSLENEGIALSTANRSEGMVLHSVAALTNIDGKRRANGKIETKVKIMPVHNGDGYRIIKGASSCSSITKHADNDSNKFVPTFTSAPSANDEHKLLMSAEIASCLNNDSSDFGGVYLGPEKTATKPTDFTTN